MAQFAVYVALGSYLMQVAGQVSAAALVLGWTVMAFGLFVLGAALENRPWARRLELARLASNAPALYLAGAVGLGAVTPLVWILLLGYSVVSLWGLTRCSGLALGTQGTEAATQPEQAAERQQTAEHP